MKSTHPQNTDEQAKFTLTNIFPTLSTCYYFWCSTSSFINFQNSGLLLYFHFPASILGVRCPLHYTQRTKLESRVFFFFLVPFKRKWDDIMKGTPSFAGFWKTRSLTSPRSNVQLQVDLPIDNCPSNSFSIYHWHISAMKMPLTFALSGYVHSFSLVAAAAVSNKVVLSCSATLEYFFVCFILLPCQSSTSIEFQFIVFPAAKNTLHHQPWGDK